MARTRIVGAVTMVAAGAVLLIRRLAGLRSGSADAGAPRRDPLDEVPEDEKVRFLDAAEVVGGAFPKMLLQDWAHMVGECRQGFPFSIEEYQNDLDGRMLLGRVLERADPERLPSVTVIVDQLDKEFREATIEVGRPVWFQDAAQSDPQTYWFYYRLPRQPSEEVLRGLRNLGFQDLVDEVLKQGRAK